MMQNYFGETWKIVQFDFEYTNDNRIEVSNFGRIRTFNKMSNGKIMKLSMINGYQIIRIRFFRPKESAADDKINHLQKQVLKLTQDIRQMKAVNESNDLITETAQLLITVKKKLKKQFAEATKKRTIHYHTLIHRLVAKYFLNRPSDEHTIVAHRDHDKVNNSANNLKWMTPEENYKHQQSSPHVIKVKQEKRERRKESSKATKLTVTKVMLLKKMLNQGKPVKQLVRQFKVTDTQIFRIKRGENWTDIEAAK